MIRCSRCVLPEAYPNIKFDMAGVCHKCKEHDAKFLNRDYARLGLELAEIFDWAKRQKKRYDCIVPFSGGKDSSYTLYLCRERYRLSVLAVNFNNGFRTLAALRNIENMIRRTDVAYACYGPNWRLLRNLYRAFFLATGQFCFPCDMGIWATVHRVAEQYDVPLIVSGFSAQIESRGPQIYSYDNNVFRNVVGDRVSRRDADLFLAESKWQKLKRRLKHGRLTRYRRQISLPDYVVWDDDEIKHTITEKLGWQRNEDGSSDHIDCLFAPVKNYLVVQKWGFGEKTTKYSAMVRAGQMTRDEALERAEEEEGKDISNVLQTFVETLELSWKDIEQAKTKTHLSYF